MNISQLLLINNVIPGREVDKKLFLPVLHQVAGNEMTGFFLYIKLSAYVFTPVSRKQRRLASIVKIQDVTVESEVLASSNDNKLCHGRTS